MSVTQWDDQGGPAQPPTFRAEPDPAALHWHRQTDLQHLKLLSIFYYVFAGLQALGVCGGAFYVLIGGAMTAAPVHSNDPNAPPPGLIGGMMMGMGGCIALFCIIWAAVTAYAGMCLGKQQRRTYCLVAAALTCISVPLGTVLGIFTFIVLARPSVMAIFRQNERQLTA
jgi:hypothetical protein